MKADIAQLWSGLRDIMRLATGGQKAVIGGNGEGATMTGLKMTKAVFMTQAAMGLLLATSLMAAAPASAASMAGQTSAPDPVAELLRDRSPAAAPARPAAPRPAAPRPAIAPPPKAPATPPAAPTAAAPAETAPALAPGEAYHRADDAQQTPEELRITRALNDEITARNTLIENQEQADRRAYEAARAQYDRERAAEAEVARSDKEQYDRAARAAEEAQRRYELALRDWQATVAACQRGDTARCKAGSQPPISPNR